MMELLVTATVLLLSICHSHGFSRSLHFARQHGSMSQLQLFQKQQQLFQKKQQKQQQQQVGNIRKSVEEEIRRWSEIEFLADRPPPLPIRIEIAGNNNDSNDNDKTQDEETVKAVVIRHLEEEDIIPLLPELVREFGALSSNSSSGGDNMASQIENVLFSMTILIGLTQRVRRRKEGYSPRSAVPPDHNVICIAECTTNNNNNSNEEQERVVGIAEVSWQPPRPHRNAPPYVLPLFVKRWYSQHGNPSAYVSNVLVTPRSRRNGYAKLMMQLCENIAKSWGSHDVRLHVDADPLSGKAAQHLYQHLGYEGVPDNQHDTAQNGDSFIYKFTNALFQSSSQQDYQWMGPAMSNQGLYIVEGIPLLYMKKQL